MLSAISNAGSGKLSLANTITALPAHKAGSHMDTKPRSGASSGAMIPSTPIDSGAVKFQYGAATEFWLPSTLPILSAQPAKQIVRSMAASTSARALLALAPVVSRSAAANSSARPSIISARRYTICPRKYGVAAAHDGCAAFAASTASRKSLRLAVHSCANTPPSLSCSGCVRPLSPRGNAPLMKSLCVLRTVRRLSVMCVSFKAFSKQ